VFSITTTTEQQLRESTSECKLAINDDLRNKPPYSPTLIYDGSCPYHIPLVRPNVSLAEWETACFFEVGSRGHLPHKVLFTRDRE